MVEKFKNKISWLTPSLPSLPSISFQSMTSIFKSYDALTLLSKNLEKLGTAQETFTKAVIQTIGEMDSMMGKFLKKNRKETHEKQKKVVEDESEEEELPVPKKKSRSDDGDNDDEDNDDEEEEEESVCCCCGKRVFLHTFNGQVMPCPFSKYQGDCKWLKCDLYLEKDKWLIIATPRLGPYVVGEKARNFSLNADFQIVSGSETHKFWKMDGGPDDDEEPPYRIIHSLSSAEMKRLKSEAEDTYLFLKGLNVL